MSNLPQIIITADSEVILNKKKAWSEVGLTVHNTNLQLEEKAKEALEILTKMTPKNIDQINGAEVILKDVKAKLAIIELERKAVTSKFDQVTSALMTHEKSVKDALPAYTNAIVAIKKAHEAEQEKIRQAEQKEKQEKEAAINYINKAYTDIKSMVADQCQKAFEYALNKSIEGDRLASYITKVKANKTEKDFTIVKPVEMRQDFFDGAWAYLDTPSPADFVTYFHKEVDKQFEFYVVALKNKDAAIQANKEAAERAALALQEDLANRNVAARLETIATSTAEIVSDVKELKRKYELDMTDSEANALLIITAFVTNFAQVKDGIRTKAWLNMSVSQMGAALAWYKNKDDKFTCTGINFKTVEKL